MASSSGISSQLILTLHGASNLVKRDLLSLPDPLAVITVDGEQTASTATVRKTLSPTWNESFTIYVKPTSVIAIQIFDHKKFKRPDQGFLGLYNLSATEAINLALSGQATVSKDLITSSTNLPVTGKISFRVATVTSMS